MCKHWSYRLGLFIFLVSYIIHTSAIHLRGGVLRPFVKMLSPGGWVAREGEHRAHTGMQVTLSLAWGRWSSSSGTGFRLRSDICVEPLKQTHPQTLGQKGRFPPGSGHTRRHPPGMWQWPESASTSFPMELSRFSLPCPWGHLASFWQLHFGNIPRYSHCTSPHTNNNVHHPQKNKIKVRSKDT